MKLDRKTLTKEQKDLEKEFWISFYITKDKKLWLKSSRKYEEYLIEKEFQNTIKSITAWYTQAEIDTWNTKVAEAKKVLAGWTSTLINSLLLKWETAKVFATNVLAKASAYSKVYCDAERKKREALKSLKI